MTQTKRCCRCGEVKPVERFQRKRKHKDGLACHCKECERKAREENRRNSPKCSVEGCEKHATYCGMCDMHNKRRLRGMSLTAPSRLTEPRTTLVDAALRLADAEDDYPEALANLERAAVSFYYRDRNRKRYPNGRAA